MNRTVNSLVFLTIAAATAVSAFGPVPAASADEAKKFDRTQASWVDCGPRLCTEYWSIEATVGLDVYMRTGSVASAEAAVDATIGALPWPISVLGASFYAGVMQETRDDAAAFAQAAEQGHLKERCVQMQWVKGEKSGPNEFSTTAHPGYCYNTIPSTYIDANGYSYTYDADVDGYVPNF
ncbi:hypothetical protein CH300_05930 [Rhodococcus sp. 15-1154-1]|nr:hypothetical protein [Rhodococcus sp. 15-1154-1]OZF07483.1 hypothetical protein CH300_05930 [Rhodococcus sp. 15-1154-1]